MPAIAYRRRPVWIALACALPLAAAAAGTAPTPDQTLNYRSGMYPGPYGLGPGRVPGFGYGF